MKRTVSLMLALVLTLGMLFTLASCGGGLSGSYEGKVDITIASYTVTYTFNGSNVEVKSVANIAGFEKNWSSNGTYTLGEDENGNKTITFDFAEDVEGAEEGVALPFAEGEENGTKYISIAGVKYNKV